MSNTNIDVSHKKVAIVLPIFNTEQYLPDCLDSILNQTHKNFIVFAVDDGSTDASPSILKSYTLQDNRIHPILIKNSGVSSARNAALEAIKMKILIIYHSLTAMINFIRISSKAI